MANDDTNPEPQDPPESDPPKDNSEEKFWKAFDERLDAAIERGVKKHIPKRSANPSGPRTDGRMTLPKFFADFLGGPFESESSRQKSGK